MLFDFFKKKKKKKEQEDKEQIIEKAERPQKNENGIYRGMYCPVCGYMEVNEDSDELPLEGFALCPNCGGQMTYGFFLKDEEGFHLALNAGVLSEDNRKKKASGGHYRVRQKGPGRKDHAVTRRMFF